MFDVSSRRNGRMFGFDYTNRDGTPATLEFYQRRNVSLGPGSVGLGPEAPSSGCGPTDPAMKVFGCHHSRGPRLTSACFGPDRIAPRGFWSQVREIFLCSLVLPLDNRSHVRRQILLECRFIGVLCSVFATLEGGKLHEDIEGRGSVSNGLCWCRPGGTSGRRSN